MHLPSYTYAVVHSSPPPSPLKKGPATPLPPLMCGGEREREREREREGGGEGAVKQEQFSPIPATGKPTLRTEAQAPLKLTKLVVLIVVDLFCAVTFKALVFRFTYTYKIVK